MQYTIVKLDNFDSAVALFDRQRLHQVLRIPDIPAAHLFLQHPTPHSRGSVLPTRRLFQPYSSTLLPTTTYYPQPTPPQQHTHTHTSSPLHPCPLKRATLESIAIL